jgi:hypothetical protein
MPPGLFSKNSSSSALDKIALEIGERVPTGLRIQKSMRAHFLLASLGLVACSANVEPSDPAPPGSPAAAEPAPAVEPAPADHARASGSEFAVAVRQPQAQPVGFVCRPGAFCEDFEEVAYAPHWGGSFTTGGGTIELGTDSASLGRGSLRLASKDAASSAYLLQGKGDVGARWSGVLGFAFRVDQVPSKYLGGPELTVKTADGPLTLRISMRPEGVYLEQRATAACLRDRCQVKSTLVAPAKPNHWYRIAVGVEANANAAPPYGRVEAAVQGGDNVSTDLSLPLYEGSAFLSAGITEGDPGQRAFADLDDVSLLVR